MLSFHVKIGIMNFNYFSLEDDDANELFITQTPKESLVDQSECSQNVSNYRIFRDEADFSSPCALFIDKVKGIEQIYNNILDEEFVDNHQNSANDSG